MSFIKRFTQLLTPVPEEISEAPGSVPPAPATGINMLLRELLKDQFVVSDELRVNLDQLKQIAAQYGLAWTASEIRDSVSRLPDEVDGITLKKGRGFELAADFYRQHIARAIASMEAEPGTPDTEELGRVAAEIVACEFEARKYARGVAMVVQIADGLVLKACDITSRRWVYLQLAVRCLQSAYEWLLDTGMRLEQGYRRTSKARAAEESSADAQDKEPDVLIDPKLLLLLKTRIAEFTEFAERLESIEALPVIPAAKLSSTPPSGEAWAGHKRYLNALLDRVKASGPPIVRAIVFELMGTMAQSEQAGSGAKMFAAAARVYEELGKAEIESSLSHLGGERLKKAAAAARHAGEPDEAKRIEASLPR